MSDAVRDIQDAIAYLKSDRARQVYLNQLRFAYEHQRQIERQVFTLYLCSVLKRRVQAMSQMQV